MKPTVTIPPVALIAACIISALLWLAAVPGPGTVAGARVPGAGGGGGGGVGTALNGDYVK